jgi:hypothetical protein
VKWAEDRREHFISSAHERQQRQEVSVGFDDDGRITALDVHVWHDHGAYTPYGIIVPIITATQLVGPYVIPVYRVVVESVYTNTVIVTPYRGAGRPQGCFAMERTMDRIADALGLDRAVVRERNLIQPSQFPYDHHLTFQDGRPVIYDSGDYPALLEKLKALVGWDGVDALRDDAEARGKLLGVGMALYVEGTGPGPYEGGHVQVLGSGKVLVSTGLTSQGQGTRRCSPRSSPPSSGCRSRTSRCTPATPAASATPSARSPRGRGDERQRRRAGRPRGAGEGDPDRRRGAGGRPGDLEIDEGLVQVRGRRGVDPAAHGRVLSNPLRYAFDEAAKQATQFARRLDDKPPVAEGDAPGWSTATTTRRSGRRSLGRARGGRGDRPADWEIDVVRYAVVHDCGNVVNPMIVEGQVHGGVAQGVGGALYERMAYDATASCRTRRSWTSSCRTPPRCPTS